MNISELIKWIDWLIILHFLLFIRWFQDYFQTIFVAIEIFLCLKRNAMQWCLNEYFWIDFRAAGGDCSAEADELQAFVRQDQSRIDRIKKRYSASSDDEAEDYGFLRRPSVRGIKTRFGSTSEIIQQMQQQLAPPPNINAKSSANAMVITAPISLFFFFYCNFFKIIFKIYFILFFCFFLWIKLNWMNELNIFYLILINFTFFSIVYLRNLIGFVLIKFILFYFPVFF